MKAKYKITYIISVVLFLLFTILLLSQERVSIGIYQDIKLAVKADDYGNKAFTTDMIFRITMQGNQQKYGYMVIFPEFETADLKGSLYTRWSANGGYIFNQFINNIEIGTTVSIGAINRFDSGTLSFGGALSLAYKFNGFKIIILNQITDRTDIGKIGYSGFAGIEINLLKQNK